MTDPHARGRAKSEKDAHTDTPAKPKAKAKGKPHLGGEPGSSDPHYAPPAETAGPKETAAKKTARTLPATHRKKGQPSDPHSLPEGYTPPFDGSPERALVYESGWDVCTEGDWGRAILSVAEVRSTEDLGDGYAKIFVRVGDREKAVWAKAPALKDIQGLVGGRIVILDNLEPTRIAGQVFNGKALVVHSRGGDMIVRADAGARPGDRVE